MPGSRYTENLMGTGRGVVRMGQLHIKQNADLGLGDLCYKSEGKLSAGPFLICSRYGQQENEAKRPLKQNIPCDAIRAHHCLCPPRSY